MSYAEKAKHIGSFAAGALIGVAIAGALWQQFGGKSNGFNPFGNGGFSQQKHTEATTGLADKAGFAVRPLSTDTAGQGGTSSQPIMLTSIIPPASNPATTTPNAAAPVNTTAATTNHGKKPAAAPRQQAAPKATSKKQQAKHHQQAAAPNTGKKSAKTTPGGNWVTTLMPGKPAKAAAPIYYSYSTDKREQAAPKGSWAANLMSDAPIKVNSGKVGVKTPKKSDIHSGAGTKGKGITGGGNTPVWQKGDGTPIEGIIVCVGDVCV